MVDKLDLIKRQDALRVIESADNGEIPYAIVNDLLKALPSAETHEIRTETHGVCLISKDDAVETVCRTRCGDKAKGCPAHSCLVIEEFDALPSADAEWIPCSERLPKAEDMYQPPEQRYLCQLEAHGVRKFCVLSRLKGAVSPFWDWYGIAVYDSEVIAWMPLPKPYKGGDDE